MIIAQLLIIIHSYAIIESTSHVNQQTLWVHNVQNP